MEASFITCLFVILHFLGICICHLHVWDVPVGGPPCLLGESMPGQHLLASGASLALNHGSGGGGCCLADSREPEFFK